MAHALDLRVGPTLDAPRGELRDNPRGHRRDHARHAPPGRGRRSKPTWSQRPTSSSTATASTTIRGLASPSSSTSASSSRSCSSSARTPASRWRSTASVSSSIPSWTRPTRSHSPQRRSNNGRDSVSRLRHRLSEAGRRKLDGTLPRARNGAVVLRGLDLARVLRARARGDLQARVAERRAGGAAPPQRELLHQGARRREHLDRRRARQGWTRCARSTTSAATAATSSCGPTSRARRRAGAAASSSASTTAGGTSSTARARSCSRRASSSTSNKADYGLVPVHCDVWAGFIFVNLAAAAAADPPGFPRADGQRDRGLSLPRDDGALLLPRRRRQPTGRSSSTRSRSSTTHPCCTRSSPRSRPGPRCSWRATRDSTTSSTVRIALVSTTVGRGWLMPPEDLKPMERLTRSGLFGAVGQAGSRSGVRRPQPRHDAKYWGQDSFQIWPNFVILFWEHGLVPHLPLLADVVQHPPVRREPLLRSCAQRARAPRARDGRGHVQGVRAAGRQHARGDADDARVARRQRRFR